MSDHRFEKKVRQKLDDLKLTPSTKLWENIEGELRKDKRRPAPIFWLPLMLLGLGAIGYFVFTGNENKGVLAENNNPAPSAMTTEREPIPVPPLKEEQAIPFVGQIDTKETSGSQPVESISTSSRRKADVGKGKNNRSSLHKEKVTVEKVSGNNPVFPASADEPTASAEEIAAKVPVKPDSRMEPGTNVVANDKKDGEKTTPEEKKEDKTAEPVKHAPEQKQEKKKTKKWAFGISASGGVSSLSEGKLGFSNAQVATVSQNREPVLSFAAPAVVPPPSNLPSKIYPGLSFGIGITAKYNLSKRFSLSAAVNYLQLNTISKVGYKFEQGNYTAANLDRTGAEAMYLPPSGEQGRDYDNKYHFIEIPLNLHTRINKSEKLPLYWNAGISFSQLIKSNSLYYDESSYLYYSNDALLKKMQTAVSTGFSFAVFNKTSRPLWIGPTVRYNISPALKKEVSPINKHFMGLGVDVKWFLK